VKFPDSLIERILRNYIKHFKLPVKFPQRKVTSERNYIAIKFGQTELFWTFGTCSVSGESNYIAIAVCQWYFA